MVYLDVSAGSWAFRELQEWFKGLNFLRRPHSIHEFSFPMPTFIFQQKSGMDQSNCPRDGEFQQNREWTWADRNPNDHISRTQFFCFLSLLQNIPHFISGILRIGSGIENVSSWDCLEDSLEVTPPQPEVLGVAEAEWAWEISWSFFLENSISSRTELTTFSSL